MKNYYSYCGFLSVSFYVEIFEGKILYAINARSMIYQKNKCFLWATEFHENYYNNLKEIVTKRSFFWKWHPYRDGK